jgi:hypothetical protein
VARVHVIRWQPREPGEERVAQWGAGEREGERVVLVHGVGDEAQTGVVVEEGEAGGGGEGGHHHHARLHCSQLAAARQLSAPHDPQFLAGPALSVHLAASVHLAGPARSVHVAGHDTVVDIVWA